MKNEIIKNFVGKITRGLQKFTQTEVFLGIWYMVSVFRVAVVYNISDDIYDSEHSFKCATKQFLCRTVCKDQFQPISMIQFCKWHLHTVILVILLGFWLPFTNKIARKNDSYNKTGQMGNVPKHIFSFGRSLLLFGIELIYAYIFCILLSKQHHSKEKLSKLIESGELFFTPPVYMCQIEKTYSPKEERWYYERENVKFRQSPAGLRVKAQLACDQSEPLCSVEHHSEKTVFVLGMSVLNCLALISLGFNIIFHGLKMLVRINSCGKQISTSEDNPEVVFNG